MIKRMPAKLKQMIIYTMIAIALLTMLFTAFTYLDRLKKAEHYSIEVEKNHNLLFHLSHIEKMVVDAESAKRGFLITRDSSFLVPFTATKINLQSSIDSLNRLVRDSTTQVQANHFIALVNERMKIMELNMKANINDTDLFKNMTHGKEEMDSIRSVASHIMSHEKELLQKTNQHKEENFTATVASSYVSLIIAFSICCIACFAIIAFFNQNRKYQQTLILKNNQLEVLNSEFATLSLASAHNLQEPMRKIRILLSRIKNKNELSVSEYSDTVQRIDNAYQKQIDANNNMIRYMDIVHMKPMLTTISLNEWMLGFIDHYNERHQIKRITTNVAVNIVADELLLQKLFFELFTNSVKNAHPSRPLELCITLEKNTRTIQNRNDNIQVSTFHVIAVSDNGRGCKPEEVEKIMHLFSRTEWDEQNNIQTGSGMGLPICRRIMAQLNGFIIAESIENKGLTTLLFFPKLGKV